MKAPGNKRRSSAAATLWKTTLIGGFVISLAGCGITQTKPALPTKPTLNPIKVDGLICFTNDDAVKLGVYIIELERR